MQVEFRTRWRGYRTLVAYQEKLTLDKLRLLAIGFQDLREGSLYIIIGELLIIAGLASVVVSIGFSLYASSISGTVTGAIIGLVIILIGIILQFMGLVKWQHGGSYFKQFDPLRYSYAESGPKFMIWSIYLLIIDILILILGLAIKSIGIVMMGGGLLIITLILLMIGEILFGVFLLRIKDLQIFYGIAVPDFTIDAILWFIGIILQFIPHDGALIGAIIMFIATILIYIHSGEAASAIKLAEMKLPAETESEEGKEI